MIAISTDEEDQLSLQQAGRWQELHMPLFVLRKSSGFIKGDLYHASDLRLEVLEETSKTFPVSVHFGHKNFGSWRPSMHCNLEAAEVLVNDTLQVNTGPSTTQFFI